MSDIFWLSVFAGDLLMISCVLLLHVWDMAEGSNEKRRWTQQDANDAARLLAGMDARRKAKAGRLGPAAFEEIADRPMSPDEKADDEKSTGSGMLDPRRQQLTSATVGEEFGRGCEKGGGHATESFEESFRSNGCACPDAPDFAVGTDRTNGHALEDW